MEHSIDCLRCGTRMRYAFTEDIQLGKTTFFLGDWPNLLAGSMRVAVYCCPQCGKVEFFTAEEAEDSSADTPQVTCPTCGRKHDFDYPRCPFCKHQY